MSFSFSKLVNFLSCSVSESVDLAEAFIPAGLLCALIDLVIKLLLMLRYLLSKLHVISSEVKSPRLLDIDWVAVALLVLGFLEDCLRLSTYSLFQVFLRGKGGNTSSGLLAKGLGQSSSIALVLDIKLGLDLLFVTPKEVPLAKVVADLGRMPFCKLILSKLSSEISRSSKCFCAKLGKERSITVSLEDLLEDEDMLSL